MAMPIEPDEGFVVIPTKKKIQPDEGFVEISANQVANEPPTDEGVFEEIPKGLEAGVQQVRGMGYGLAALGGTITGSERLKKWGVEGLADVEANTPKPAVASYADIKDISDLGKYLAYGVSSNLPNMAFSFGSGGVGAIVGKKLITKVAERAVTAAIEKGVEKKVALQIGKKIIDNSLKKAVERGAIAGAASASIGMEAGSIAGEQVQETGEVQPARAMAGAIPAGLLDVVPEWYLVKKLGWFGGGGSFTGSIAKRVGKAAGLDFMMEAPTEATQSLLERAAVPGKSLTNAEAWDEYINSFILGGATGSVMGGGLGIFSKRADGKNDPKQSKNLINSFTASGGLEEVETADLTAVLKEAEELNTNEPDVNLTDSISKITKELEARKARKKQPSDVPDFEPTPENKAIALETFRNEINTGKFSIQEAVTKKKQLEKSIPEAADELNKIIIEAEGNKLFVPERKEAPATNIETTNLPPQEPIVQPGASSQEAAGTQEGQGITDVETPRPDSISQLKTDMAKTKKEAANGTLQTKTEVNTAGDNAPVIPAGSLMDRAKGWDFANRTNRSDMWFEGAKVNEESIRGFSEALSYGGDQLQAHGMAKEATLSGAIDNVSNILQMGLDPNRRGGVLDTAPLVNKLGEGLAGATATGSAYAEGPFQLVAKQGVTQIKSSDDIAAVLVNQENADLVPQLREQFQSIKPNIIVDSYSNAGEVTKQILTKPPAPLSQTGAATVGNADEAKSGGSFYEAEAKKYGVNFNGIQKGYKNIPDKPMFTADIDGVQTTFTLEKGETLPQAIERKRLQKTEYEAREPIAVKSGVSPVTEIPLNRIKLSKDVPQFKGDANEKGVVQALHGKEYRRVPMNAVILWERKNGDLELITGRHRLDLAQRLGEKTIPSQVVKESEGFTAQDALTFDAEQNIIDNQGTEKDYANYFRNTNISEDEARSRGLLRGTKAASAWILGKNSTDQTFNAYFRTGEVTFRQAVAVSKAAPNDERLQLAGRSFVTKNPRATDTEVENFVHALSLVKDVPKQVQGDLFGFDDSAIRTAEMQAKKAASIIGRLRRDSSNINAAIRGEGKLELSAEGAKEYGIKNQKDKEQLKAARSKILSKIGEWEKWYVNPDLVRQLTEEKADVPEAGPVKTEKTDAGDQAVIPGASYTETFDLTNPETEISKPLPQQVTPKNEDLFGGKKPAAGPAYGSKNKIFTEDKAEKARAILKAKLNGTQLNAGIDPEILTAGIDLAGYHIEAGARKFVDFSAKMIADIGDTIKPYLKSLYLAVRNYPGIDNKGMNTEAELDRIITATKKLTYDEFVSQYEELVNTSGKYKPNEVGFDIHTDKMAKLADDYPEFMERYDNEEEANLATPITEKTPYEYGKEAFAKGLKHVPYHDTKEYWKPGTYRSAEENEQWLRGWTEANLAAPVEKPSSKTISILPPKDQKGSGAFNIARLLKAHNLLDEIMKGEDFYRKIINPPYQDLTIERHGNDLYFTHYYKQNGDLIMDGEMVWTVDNDGKLSLKETAVQDPIRGGELRGHDNSFSKVFARNLIHQGFDKAKPVNPKEKEQAETKISPYSKVADAIAEKLKSKTKFTRNELFAMCSEAFGGTLAEGKFSAKDAYDAMEMGINKYIYDGMLNLPQGQKEAENVVGSLKKLFDLIPTQTTRTAEMDEFQQFSTPPALAFAANWVANLNENDVYMEPSAGTGNIAIFAKIAGAKETVVNELAPRRAAILKELGFDQVFTENAEQINNILPKEIKPTVVVMNPPFSATAGRIKGERKTSNATVHIEQALKRLVPGGRLVAIVGEGMAADRPTFKPWFNKLAKEYIIRANIGISGQEYVKYGTSFGNQLLVIDKPLSPKSIDNTDKGSIIESTGRVDKIEQLIDLLEGVRNERINLGEQRPAEQGEQESPDGTQTGTGRDESLQPAAGTVGLGEQSGRPGRAPDDNTGRNEGMGAQEGGVVPGPKSGNKGSGRTRTVGKGKGESVGTGRSNTADDTRQIDHALAELPAEAIKSLEVEQRAEVEKHSDELSDSVYDTYRPAKLQIPGAKDHPGKLVESAAMASVEPIDPNYQPKLPEQAIKNGKISMAQLESVVYAGQAHQEILPSGERKGFFIGDGTGVGKGREIASILWDNWNHGRKKAIWLSQNSPLMKDAERDIKGIGWNPKLLFDVGKVKLQASIQPKEGIGFVGYGTLRSKKVAEGKETSRLGQLIDWLGKDFDGCIIFDESHNMGNALPIKGQRGTSKPSSTALAGVEIQKALPSARVVYVSATGATEVMNLAYASRLGLWGDKTPYPNATSFVSSISAGGITAMEMVAMNMKANGVYIARSLAYDDIKYERLEHDLTGEQREIYDELAQAWQVAQRDINAAMVITNIVDDHTGATLNSDAKSHVMAQFWGTNQRFWNQVITAMQMPTVIKTIEKDVQEGHAPIIQLINTNEAAQERAIGRLEEEDTLEDLDITPKEMLIEYVKNSFPVYQFEIYTDDEGNERSRLVEDSEGNPVINKEAVEKREELLMKIGAIRVPDGPLEMILDHFGVENVAEVTGRSRRVVYKDTPEGRQRVIESWGKNKGIADADAFMDDRKKMLIFSQAGGTGRSYHADKTAKNQRLRRHYLVQAGWRADVAVQGLGRSHRTNQEQAPEWVLVTTDLEGQKRFISSIARRLSQLGALTKGSRETGNQGLFNARDNLESQEAKDAFHQLLHDLYHNDVPGITMGEFIEDTGLNNILDKQTGALNVSQLPDITQFLNRILNMRIERQNTIFGEFAKRLNMKVAKAIEDGTLDVGVETIRAKKTEKINEQVVYEDEKTRAQAKYIEVELTHDAKLMPFNQSVSYNKFGYVQNIKSGRIWVLASQRNKTNALTGEIENQYSAVGANYNYHVIAEADIKNPEKYREIPDSRAEALWNKDYEAAPKEIQERVHMITGTILPIWDRLPTGQARIYRLNVDGRNIIGRVIDKGNLEQTLKKLGATRKAAVYKPEDIFNNVLNRGYSYTLSNDWTIGRRKVADDYRIEIKGPSYIHIDELRKYGVFTERISYETRFFIPSDSDTGVKAIKEIISSRPVVDETAAGKKAGHVTTKDVAFMNETGKGTVFSRGKNESGQSLTRDELERHANQLMGNAKNKPELIVVEKVSDLPFDAIEDARGILYDGKMYLVAEQIATTEDANEVIFHEFVGHFGLRGFFGDTLNSALDKIHVNNPRIRQYTNEWMKSNRDFQKQHNLSDLDYHYRAIEEAMARMAQENRPFTLARRLLHTVQTLLRKIGMTRLADMLEAKSDAEAMTMLHQARLFIDKGKTLGGSSQGQGIYYSRAQADPPVSRDPKVLNLYLKDETDAIVQTIMNKLHPKNMTWLETMLKSPEWFDHPVVSKIVKLFMRDRNELYHTHFNDLNMADDVDAPTKTVAEAGKALKNKGLSLADRMAGKESPEYQKLTRFLDYFDTSVKKDNNKSDAENFADCVEYMKKHGATDDVIRVWKLYRQSYDKALDLQTRQLREMIAQLIEEAAFRGEQPNITELKQTLKYALAEMEQWKGYYAPRIREAGDWKVQAYKQHGPLETNREYYREHRGSELSAQRLAKKLEREGWKVYSVGKVEKLPESIYQDVKAAAAAKLIDSALEKVDGNSDIVKINSEVLRAVADEIRARGFRSHMIHRKSSVIKGYIEDPIKRHLLYTNQLAGGLAKAAVARMAFEELLGQKFQGKQYGGIDPVADPEAYKVATDYIEEQLRNLDRSDRVIALAKSIATFKFLGFNIRSLAVNMTAIVTTAPAAIHQYAMGGNGSMFRAMKELGFAGKDFGSFMAGRPLSNSDEQAFLDEMHKKGWDDPQYTRDALGTISKTHSRIWSTIMDGSMYLFGASEKWNRGTTVLAAYRMARKQGDSHAVAAEKAKEASDRAHGVYGRATLPMWAQGTNPAAKIGQMAYVYWKFSHNYLQMLYDLGFKKHNIKAVMFAFLSPLVVAGGAALPFKDVIFGVAGFILSSLSGDDRDPEKWVWDEIRKHLGDDAEVIGRHGLTGAAGVDISGSISIGVGVPKNLMDLTGAIGGVIENIGDIGTNIKRGQPGKALEAALPSGVSNIVRAYRERTEGASTRANRRVWDNKGKPFVPTVGETAARGFGFRSTRQAVLSERTWEGHREQAEFNDKRKAIYERYRGWLLGGKDEAEHKKIVKLVREYNDQTKGLPRGEVSRITFEGMRAQAKGMSKPAKKERALLQ